MECSSKRIRRSRSIKVININGQIFNEEEAKISVFDRGFLFGDSVYEVTDAIDNIPIFFDEHLDRLWRSANMINMPINITKSEIKNEVEKTLNKLNAKRAYIRIVITRGEGEITLDPQAATHNNLVIITKEIKDNPSWWYETGVEIIVADTRRTSTVSMDPAIKSGNYLNNILAYTEATKQGAFDAVMLNHDGLITEGTTSNIWIVKDQKIITPPLKAGLLGGITRAKIIEILKKQNISYEESNFNEEDLKDADEVFLTSSTKRIIPVVKVDHINIGNGIPGKITKKIIDLYKKRLNFK